MEGFTRGRVNLPITTLTGWISSICHLVEPLGKALAEQVLQAGDKDRARYALQQIGLLYDMERECKGSEPMLVKKDVLHRRVTFKS